LQVPAASSQESVVHARPSLQVLAVTQKPPELHWPQPAVMPSLQVWPVRAVQLVVLTAGLHHSQGLLPRTVIAA
jgi:hypothetical protein